VTGRVAAAKTRLRAALRERLAAVPDSERDARSASIVERLEGLVEVRDADSLLLHRSLRTEVSLERLLATALARGQSVLVPRVDGARLIHVEIDEDTSWRRSTLGVLEPLAGDSPELCGKIVALIPGLAFDAQGGRLGRGGGHYDRFLREMRGTHSIHAIGVAFDVQIVEHVPMDDHDERVDRVVTESRVLSP
jgi:5-formyltetrahydrofolate cyclo-ligase